MTDQSDAADTVLSLARARGIKIGTAESCTGGLVAGALTDRAGSSDVFELGLVTYSNAAKTRLLGVPAALIDTVGAVSSEVALAMASGALDHYPQLDLVVSVTGIAGPGGGSPEKPVGLVYLAVALRHHTAEVQKSLFAGDRRQIREATVLAALSLLRRALSR